VYLGRIGRRFGTILVAPPLFSTHLWPQRSKLPATTRAMGRFRRRRERHDQAHESFASSERARLGGKPARSGPFARGRAAVAASPIARRRLIIR